MEEMLNQSRRTMEEHRRPVFLFIFTLFYLSHARAAGAEPPSPFSTALETLEEQIEYKFQFVDLLRQAMTHPSYSLENYRALSILGVSTIEVAVSLRLLQENIDASAGDLSRRISDICGVDACAAIGSRLGLEKVVRVSAKTNSSSPAVVCGAFRATVGAIAVDSGKVDTARDVFWRVRGSGFAADF